MEDMCYGIRRAEANLLLKGCSKSENLSLSLSLPRGPSDHGCVLKDRGTREERETEIGTLGTALQEQICCDYDDFRQSSKNKKKSLPGNRVVRNLRWSLSRWRKWGKRQVLGVFGVGIHCQAFDRDRAAVTAIEH